MNSEQYVDKAGKSSAEHQREARESQEKLALRKSMEEHQPLELIDVSQTKEEESTKLKLEINELVWRYAGENTTLARADEIATKFWLEIMETHK